MLNKDMVKKLDITKILHKEIQRDHSILIQHVNNGRFVCLKKKSSNMKPIIINRHILICNSLFEGLGLWSGDGWKVRVFGFSNCEPKLVRKFIEFCRLLGIQKTELNWELQLIKNPNNINKIVNLYSEKIGLKKNQFRNYVIQERTHNCIRVYRQSNLLPVLINIIFDYLIRFIAKNVRFGTSYLKGVFATDGWVVLRKGLGTIKHVGIAVQSPRFREIYISAFSLLGINIQIDNKGIWISSREDFVKIKRLKLLELHCKKEEKFRKGFIKFCSGYGDNKYKTLCILANNNDLSAYELAELFSITPRSARRIFQQLQLYNYIKYKKDRDRHIYSITNKGKILLNEDRNLVSLGLAYLRHKI